MFRGATSESVSMLKKKQFLPTITTTRGSDWQEKIKEIDKLAITRAAVFPTCLLKPAREKLYGLLEKSCLQEIPLVHLRSDMLPSELDYFINKWQTKVFNTHSQKEFPFQYDLSKFKKMIYIENIYTGFDPEEIKDFAGLCLDFSHLENDKRLHKENFKKNIAVLKQFPIGCNHISAVASQTHQDIEGSPIYAVHRLTNLSELDYLKNYPLKWFSDFIAIELENSLKEQIEAIDYIVKTI